MLETGRACPPLSVLPSTGLAEATLQARPATSCPSAEGSRGEPLTWVDTGRGPSSLRVCAEGCKD